MKSWLGCAFGCALVACSSEEPGNEMSMGGSGGSAGSNGAAGSAGSAGSGGGAAGSGGAMGTGRCNAVLVSDEPTSASHFPQCSAIEYSTNPPSGGDHYGAWAAFQTYDFPVPPGNLVHALEHGAVVFWYNCPEGCADEVADVETFIAALPVDVSCVNTGAERRAILTPSPSLEARWAASAWGFALTADCFDEEAFADFYADHYGRGPEDLCVAGQAFSTNPCP